MLSINEFRNVDLRAGRVLAAEPVEGSEKLLKLMVGIGNEERQILAGIAPYYAPDVLIGRSVIIVANLEPRSLMGLESQGMLLCVEGDTPVLLTTEREVAPGAKVK